MSNETKLYLAGSWKHRPSCRLVAERIADTAGWKLTASWRYTGDEESVEDRTLGAERDLDEIYAADRFVMLVGDGTSPGKHTELGYAIGRLEPVDVRLVVPPWIDRAPEDVVMDCVFYHLVPAPVRLRDFLEEIAA